MASRSGQVKGALTDQTLIAGIGNAYSDEILHAARLSPFKMANKIDDDELIRLYDAMRATLEEAVKRQRGQKAATMKGEKRSGLMVHARTGLPCPVCGDTVREVSFADTSLQYCPTCQTGGKPLADRRMSKLLRSMPGRRRAPESVRSARRGPPVAAAQMLGGSPHDGGRQACCEVDGRSGARNGARNGAATRRCTTGCAQRLCRSATTSGSRPTAGSGRTR